MTNCFKFEATKIEFPERIETKTVDSFIQDTFSISYGPPQREKLCVINEDKKEKHKNCQSISYINSIAHYFYQDKLTY